MNLDLSKFKKVEETKHVARLQHPDGHEISISKKALSTPVKNQLAKLPMHFADAGEVPDPQNPMMQDEANDPAYQKVKDQPMAAPQQQPVTVNINNTPPAAQPAAPEVPLATRIGQVGGNIAGKITDAVMPGLPLLQGVNQIAHDPSVKNTLQNLGQGFQQEYTGQTPNQAAPMTPEPNQPGMENPASANPSQDQINQATKLNAEKPAPMNFGEAPGYNDIIGGLKGQADIEGRLGENKAELIGEHIQQERSRIQEFNDNKTEFETNLQNLSDDAQKGHIDPNQYINNMSTGKKIRTAIGLILGGMGAGLAGSKTNPVQEALQTAIQNDIQSQKANIDSKHSLLRLNLDRYHNMMVAEQVTEMQTKQMLMDSLDRETAAAQGDLAKQRLLMLKGQIEQGLGPQIQRTALLKTMLSQQQAGGARQAPNPEQLVPLVVPKEDQQQVFKDIAGVKANQRVRDAYLKAFDDIHGQFMNGILSPKDVASARQAIIGKIIKETEGRYNFEAAQNLASALFPDKLASGETANKQRARGVELLNTLNVPERLGAYPMIQVPNTSRYDEQGNDKLKSKLRPPVLKK